MAHGDVVAASHPYADRPVAAIRQRVLRVVAEHIDVAQLVGMLDEVISELRVAAGQSSFDVSLVANVAMATPEELLPTPSFRESMEQALAAAASVAEPSERISLLDAVTAALTEPARGGGWAAALRLRALTEVAAERRRRHSECPPC